MLSDKFAKNFICCSHNHYKRLNHETTNKDVELSKSNILLVGLQDVEKLY